jgi:hypothetical protein
MKTAISLSDTLYEKAAQAAFIQPERYAKFCQNSQGERDRHGGRFWEGESRRLSPAQGEPKRRAFWFSEFGVKPQTPPKDAEPKTLWVFGFQSLCAAQTPQNQNRLEKLALEFCEAKLPSSTREAR